MGKSDVIVGFGAVLFGGVVYFLVLDSKGQATTAGAATSNVTAVEAPLTAEERATQREAREEAKKGKVFNGPMFQLYRDDGRVNARLLDLAGIPLSKKDEVDDLLQAFNERLSAELDARRVPIPEETDAANRKLAFRVPADPEAARAAKAEFEEEMRSRFGEAAARIFTPYVTREGFAGWGEYDLEIRFSVEEGWGGEKRVVNYKGTDPASGKMVMDGGTSDPDWYRKSFGTAFSDVKLEKP